MNHNPYLTERLAQLTVAEVQRASRYAWPQSPPRRRSPRALLAATLLLAGSGLASLLYLLA
jgi:hypothetical protein